MNIKTAKKASRLAFFIVLVIVSPGTLPAQSGSSAHLTMAGDQDGDRADASTADLEVAATEGDRAGSEPLIFREIWAYLMAGEEQFVPSQSSITDLAYFSARISSKGELYGVPDIRRLDQFKARKHLVVAEVSNQALIHFVLDPAYPLRDKLIRDIATAAVPYNGVNIDFELMRTDDGPVFLEFITLLKQAIGSRTLSVCVPARTRKMNDAYDYQAIAAIADRVFVMAYDEHWSGSAAGPVASIGWASRVSTWAAQAVEPDKLIIGMPFYGRAWGDSNPAGAYKHSGVSSMINETGVAWDRNPEGIPFLNFQETISFTLFFDDAESIRNRGLAYHEDGIRNIGFWRLGQEDPEVWKILGTELEEALP
ncbi:MAG: glycosyl hydrolase family 18 protein [Spirochaetia bacterium]|jgi:spore germination protein YaaH|nr:glycosyl hydrolase family 18 protein [Spirochaetia bacterium]